MHIAILTFDGFNEIDSLVALGILGRVGKPRWRVSIASPSKRVVSMNGVALQAGISLHEAGSADAIVVGSGTKTREIVADRALLSGQRVVASLPSTWPDGSLHGWTVLQPPRRR